MLTPPPQEAPSPAHNVIHAVPVFGCGECILSERMATCVDAYKNLVAPPCPECGRAMVKYDYNPLTMTIDCLCSSPYDHDGEPTCDGGVSVKIR